MNPELWVGFIKLFNVLYYRILPIVILSLLSYAIWWVIERLRSRLSEHTPEVRSAALGFSFVGIAIGIMVGMSREPIAHIGIPGFLGLVTAFAAYAFAKDSLDQFRPYAVPIIMTLSMTLVFGVYFGAALREDREVAEKAAEHGRATLTGFYAARTDICKQVALKAIEAKADPVQALPEICAVELGFVPLTME